MNISVTKKIEETLEYLEAFYSVVIVGRPGEGKTVCAYTVAKELINKGLISYDKCIVMSHPNELKHVKGDKVDLIVMDNMFGKYNADQAMLSNWRNHFETLESLTLSHKVRVIIASRMHILLEYKHELDNCQVFANRIHLDSTTLTTQEKRGILQCQLKRFGRHMEEEEIDKCVSQHTSVFSFPLCCQLFASDENQHLKAELFNTSFAAFLDGTLRVLSSKCLVALMYVFCASNGLKSADLNIATISETGKTTLCHIAELCGSIIPIEILVKETRNSTEYLKGTYLRDKNGGISFLHETMYEAVARLMLRDCPKLLLDKCNVHFLCQCIRLDRAKNDAEVVVETDYFESFAKRCIYEVIEERNADKISKHPAFKDVLFIDVFFAHLTKSDESLRDFFCAGSTLERTGLHGFLYHILSEGQSYELFFDQAYKHLACYHSSDYDDACWKCQVKEECLAAVCSSNNEDLYEKLSQDDVRMTSFCLFKATENQRVNPKLVSRIIDDLKSHNNFMLDQGCIQTSLGLSMRHDNDTVFQILHSNGIRPTVHFLYFAVQKGDVNLLSSTIKQLIKEKRWKSDNYYVSRAILEARIEKNEPMLNILSSFGARITEGAVYWAIVDHTFDDVVSVVQAIKETGRFDCNSIHLAWALAIAIKDKNQMLHDYLRKEGVVATPPLVAMLAFLGEPSSKIADVIQELESDHSWDTENRHIANAYMFARKREHSGLLSLLKAKGVGMSPGCLYYALLYCVDEAESIMKLLKSMNRFDPRDKVLARTLVWATEFKDSKCVRWLEKSGLCFNMACMTSAIKTSISLATLETVIEKIKAGGQWDTSCDDARVALNHACRRQDKTTYELLVSEGIEMCPRSIFLATKHETLYGLKLVIKKLDEEQMLDSSSQEFANAVTLAKTFKNRQKYHELRFILQNQKDSKR